MALEGAFAESRQKGDLETRECGSARGEHGRSWWQTFSSS